MASGSRRRRPNGDEYIFLDGKAVRSDEAVRIVDDQATVPGQLEAAQDADIQKAGRGDEDMESKRADSKPAGALFVEEKRTIRKKCLIFGGVLLVLIFASLCISMNYHARVYNPLDIILCIGHWVRLSVIGLVDSTAYLQEYHAVIGSLPMYDDMIFRAAATFKYVAAGIMLSVSGMLFQNCFRNPIAAPSMLGVSNGVTIALVILVLQFGAQSLGMIGTYYLYTFVGGVAIVVLVLLSGKIMSGKGEFNVTNMLLAGTLISQLLGIVITYIQGVFLTDTSWDVFYRLQTATGLTSAYTYATLVAGLVLTLVPVILLRFKLNLISFTDGESRLMGANTTALRVISLVCGSIMILVAQVNIGQVAMISLVVPFISRAVFGSEFRKQLLGSVLIGSIVLLVCGDFVSLVLINYIPLDIGTVVTVCVLPLFIWMLAVRQRSWE